MKVKIERIKVMERIRKEITLIEELAEDIKKNGLINPVTVMSVDDEMYQLLAGLRRLKAVQMLGWTEITISVVAPADAEAALRIEISENEQREPFTFSEQMDFAKLLEEIEKEKAKERKSEGQVLGGKTAGRGRPLDDSLCDDRRTSYEAKKKPKQRASDVIGEKIGMSGRQYDRARHIVENAPDEVIEELDNGNRSISAVYSELRSQEKAKQQKSSVDIPPAATKLTKPKPLKSPPDSYLTEQDKEAMRKIREFSAMSPEEKVTELQRQLKEERARAASAESELARLKELRHNDNLHNNANIENLKLQLKDLNSDLTTANARIKELEDRYEPKK